MDNTTPKTVAILEPGYASYLTERTVLADQAVTLVPVTMDADAVPALQKLDPVALLVRERDVTAALLAACPNLKLVVRYGVGVDNIDLDAATKRSIYVANVPDYGAEIEVSEHALALYLAVQRRVVLRDQQLRAGGWGIGQAATIPSRENAVLGLIGCGRIGLETARKFRVFGFDKVMAFDPFLNPDTAKAANVDLVDLETLCKTADVINLHAPLTPQTHHIVDAAHIALMKPTTILVNVARGGLLDEAALAQALHEGRLFGAGIDVFEQEPVAPDNPLLTAPNTTLSDHTAWYSERSVKVLQQNAAYEVRRVLQGNAPLNWVNPWPGADTQKQRLEKSS
ncbi:C-terminal binding protein [Roseobacter sp. N2S]|uniref:C-terminal binding protein n=1 Tax=Roseobacter sp. N2S TaxID=2663844 RepID=UPI002866E1F3|nr:C-terminal binding protein [Roseobacter sp. N2S]MDR6267003.1 D-3-phosphoglycerate dehydrogenase [Roseobacter sp. N2S]